MMRTVNGGKVRAATLKTNDLTLTVESTIGSRDVFRCIGDLLVVCDIQLDQVNFGGHPCIMQLLDGCLPIVDATTAEKKCRVRVPQCGNLNYPVAQALIGTCAKDNLGRGRHR